MPGNPGHGGPRFPDPNAIDALAQQWLNMGASLGGLASLAGQVMAVPQWAGDAQASAVAASAGVKQVIQTAADNATAFGNGLHQYADQVRQAIAAAKASFWTAILGLVFTLVTLGLTVPLMALVEEIAAILASVGLAIRWATFAAGAAVFTPVAFYADLESQLLAAGIAGTSVHLSPVNLALDAAAK